MDSDEREETSQCITSQKKRLIDTTINHKKSFISARFYHCYAEETCNNFITNWALLLFWYFRCDLQIEAVRLHCFCWHLWLWCKASYNFQFIIKVTVNLYCIRTMDYWVVATEIYFMKKIPNWILYILNFNAQWGYRAQDNADLGSFPDKKMYTQPVGLTISTVLISWRK